MAEYIDKSEVLELKRDYGEGQYSMMLIDPALVKKLPTIDVVEREKIDKAIKIATDSISVCFKLGLNERAFGMQEILQIFTRIQEGKDEESID